MKKKTLFFTIANLSSGGAERVISILSNKLVADNYHVSVLMWYNNPIFYQFDERVRIISIEKCCNSKNFIKKMIWFRTFVKNEKPNILLSFLAIFNILTLISLLGVSVKKVVCERNDPRHTPFRPCLRLIRNWIYFLADGVLTQTDNNKTYFNKRLQKKVEVIYNPIFLSEEYINSACKATHKKKIISVARLLPQKNQKMLINAFAKFSIVHPEYSLHIFGKGASYDELNRLIGELELSDKVLLRGVTDNVFEELKSSDFFVLSSNFEGMPNTLLEAMCVGLPCISTKVSGAVDLIKDEENGFLVDIGNEDQLASKMCLLADNNQLRESIGNQASKLFEKLNINTISLEWEDYIEKIIDKE